MDQNEEPRPHSSPNRTITLRLTRDTLILVAALVLMGLAILLTVFFPLRGVETTAPTAVGIAGQTTAPPSLRATTLAPTATSLSDITTAPSPAAYPPLQTTAPAVAATLIAALPATPTPEPPRFEPTRTTPIPAATAAGGFNQQTGGNYPPPIPRTAQTTLIPPTAQAPQRPPVQAGPTTTPEDGGQGDDFVDATATPDALSAPTTSQPPAATVGPPPAPRTTPRPRPTPAGAAGGGTGPPAPPAATATPPPPTAIPIDVLRGTINWTTAQSPILITRDQQIAPGGSLVIEPGVEVRLAPGVSIFVDGALYALGKPDRKVRFVGSEGQRWEGLFGRPGSTIVLEHTQISGGGAGGTVILNEGGSLAMRNSQINNNGGHIQSIGGRIEMRDSEIAGNDMPYGAALDATYNAGGSVILVNNRIGGNRMGPGVPPVQISNQSAFDVVNLDIQRNLLIGQDGPDLILSTNGPLQGNLTCNALMNGANGLSVRSETPQVPGFALLVRDNVIEDHTPPIIPIYLQYGIGRGATSEIALDMRNNWWGDPLGPYEPDRHADGRGEAVGDTIEFAPWLIERPACAPRP